MSGRPSEGALAVAAKIARLKRQGQQTNKRRNHGRESIEVAKLPAGKRRSRALKDKRAFNVDEEVSGAMSYGVHLVRNESMSFRAAAGKAGVSKTSLQRHVKAGKILSPGRIPLLDKYEDDFVSVIIDLTARGFPMTMSNVVAKVGPARAPLVSWVRKDKEIAANYFLCCLWL